MRLKEWIRRRWHVHGGEQLQQPRAKRRLFVESDQPSAEDAAVDRMPAAPKPRGDAEARMLEEQGKILQEQNALLTTLYRAGSLAADALARAPANGGGAGPRFAGGPAAAAVAR